MRLRRFLKGLWILLFIVCAALTTLVMWNAKHMLYPRPETESAFLQHYTPERVISRFKANESSGFGHHLSSAAGQKYVRRDAGFDSSFVMCPAKWMPLMNALQEGASQQLVANGAHILTQTGDPRTGFRFDYKAGHVIGSLTILPLIIGTPSNMHRATQLPAGLVDVTARIDQTEMWFPKDPGMIQISVANCVQ
jgi:hypothetical protein